MSTITSKNRQGVGGRLQQEACCVAAGLLLLVAALPGCHSSIARGETMHLASTSFPDRSSIPMKYTYSGADFSPPPDWIASPVRTATLGEIFPHPDAPGRTFTHWV